MLHFGQTFTHALIKANERQFSKNAVRYLSRQKPKLHTEHTLRPQLKNRSGKTSRALSRPSDDAPPVILDSQTKRDMLRHRTLLQEFLKENRFHNYY